jgi:sulfate transport system ATP-binding protein
MEVPEDTHPEGQAVMYVRPHLLDIEQQPSGADHFRARVNHINRTGPLVKIELMTEWGDVVNVEMSQERFLSLGLRRDLEVFLKPKEVRVFSANGSR